MAKLAFKNYKTITIIPRGQHVKASKEPIFGCAEQQEVPAQLAAARFWIQFKKQYHAYSGLALGHKQRGTTVICDNMGGSWDHHAK